MRSGDFKLEVTVNGVPLREDVFDGRHYVCAVQEAQFELVVSYAGQDPHARFGAYADVDGKETGGWTDLMARQPRRIDGWADFDGVSWTVYPFAFLPTPEGGEGDQEATPVNSGVFRVRFHALVAQPTNVTGWRSHTNSCDRSLRVLSEKAIHKKGHRLSVATSGGAHKASRRDTRFTVAVDVFHEMELHYRDDTWFAVQHQKQLAALMPPPLLLPVEDAAPTVVDLTADDEPAQPCTNVDLTFDRMPTFRRKVKMEALI